MSLIVEELLVLITIQFVGAVDNCFTVSMRITNKIYSILLAEKGPCRPEKEIFITLFFFFFFNYRTCVYLKVCGKNICINS